MIIDKDEKNLNEIKELSCNRILCDGIDFLVNNFHLLNPSNTIIPAVPVHLAFELVKKLLDKDFRTEQIEIPGEIQPFLPHTWPGSEGSLLVSYADFLCPDDCPEPEDYCTVTGKERGIPLYELLGQLDLLHYRVHIMRSHQLAPGLGGYKADELKGLVSRVRKYGTGRWLVGTACSCHGMVSALEISQREPNRIS